MSVSVVSGGSLGKFRSGVLQKLEPESSSPPAVDLVSDVGQSTSDRPAIGEGLSDLRNQLEAEADDLWNRLANGPLPPTAYHMVDLLKSSYFWLTFSLVLAGESYNSYYYFFLLKIDIIDTYLHPYLYLKYLEELNTYLSDN